jgi:imidazoleglycerol phosphate synthase cyclase subunit
MLTRRIIPCLDIDGGRVVKGIRFQGLRDSGDPAELAARYEAEGADEIALLDISAGKQSRIADTETIARVRAVLSIPLTVGGGVRSADDADRLLNAGADKVGLNTAAALRPELISECAERFGSQCIVASIDAARSLDTKPTWNVRIKGGDSATPLDAVEWASRAESLGAGEILLTSWDRDGTTSGFDLDLTAAVAHSVHVPVIASGGASNPSDFVEAIGAGAEAVLAATIFHEARFSVQQIKQFLKTQGVEVRL